MTSTRHTSAVDLNHKVSLLKPRFVGDICRLFPVPTLCLSAVQSVWEHCTHHTHQADDRQSLLAHKHTPPVPRRQTKTNQDTLLLLMAAKAWCKSAWIAQSVCLCTCVLVKVPPCIVQAWWHNCSAAAQQQPSRLALCKSDIVIYPGSTPVGKATLVVRTCSRVTNTPYTCITQVKQCCIAPYT
jgi:hypothetical protein